MYYYAFTVVPPLNCVLVYDWSHQANCVQLENCFPAVPPLICVFALTSTSSQLVSNARIHRHLLLSLPIKSIFYNFSFFNLWHSSMCFVVLVFRSVTLTHSWDWRSIALRRCVCAESFRLGFSAVIGTRLFRLFASRFPVWFSLLSSPSV